MPQNPELLHTVVVEDNPALCESLVATLEELACVKVVATTGMEDSAVRWLTEHPDGWQLAIVDLFLRSGSGLHLVERLPPRGPLQKVVVFSNYVNASVRKHCAQLGVDAVFDKSTELDALVDYCARQGFLQASARRPYVAPGPSGSYGSPGSSPVAAPAAAAGPAAAAP